MPPQAELPAEYLYKKFQEWPIFDKNGNLTRKSDPVWQKIRASLQCKMSAESLYLYLFKDYHLARTRLEKHFNIQSNKNKIQKIKDVDYNPYVRENQNPKNCQPLTFELILPVNKIIASWTKEEKCKGWTQELRKLIWKNQQLPCAFNLQNSYITNGQLIFNGFCSDCLTGISGKSELIDEQYMKIIINTFDTQVLAKDHTKKTKLSGVLRKEAKMHLLRTHAVNFREEGLANLSAKYEPAHLNTTVTYRKTREESQDEHIGYNDFKNQSITNKRFLDFCSVRRLSLNPFYVCYWSKEQMQLWNALQDQNLPLSFDATGSLVKKYQFYEGDRSKSIHFYVLVLGFKNKIIPLLQVLLSIHHVSVIVHVLNLWIESGAAIPKEIRTDGSLAIQNSVTVVFNQMTYEYYNLYCYKLLLKEVHILPKCYYRHDIAHLLNLLRFWKCLKGFDKDAVNFYLRCIGYLSQVETLEDFEDVVTAIVIVSNSMSIEDDSVCFVMRESLIKLFKTYEHIDKIDVDDKVQFPKVVLQEKIEKAENKSAKNKWISRVDTIFEDAKTFCYEDEEAVERANLLYNPGFSDNFQNLCYTSLAWTNMMKGVFNSSDAVATSARSEAYFKIRKADIPYPISVKKFLLKERLKIKALTNFALSKLPEESKTTKENLQSDFLNLDLENLKISNPTVANFSDQSPNCNVMETDSFISILQDLPDINVEKPQDTNNSEIIVNKNFGKVTSESACFDQSCDISTLNVSVSRNILQLHNIKTSSPSSSKLIMSLIDDERKPIRNGNLIPLRNYFINNSMKQLVFINTCPFDSIFEIMTSMYVENESLRADINEQKNLNPSGFLNAVADYADSRFARDALYETRSRILYPIYRFVRTRNKRVVLCTDNITRAFEVLMKWFQSMFNVTTCPCGFEGRRLAYKISLSTQDFFRFGLENLQTIMDKMFGDKGKVTCLSCYEKIATPSYILGNYFAIDVEYVYEDRNLKMIQRTVKNAVIAKTKIRDIPLRLKLMNEQFRLKGVVCFMGETKTNATPVHYFSYISSKNEKWKLFDDRFEEIKDVPEETEEKLALLVFQRDANTSMNILDSQKINISSSMSSKLIPSLTDIDERKLIQNDNLIPIKNYYIDESLKNLVFNNTCSFDSVFEIVTSSYLENEYLRIDIDKQKNLNQTGFLNSIVDYVVNHFTRDFFYENRSKILYSIYRSAKTWDKRVCVCTNNIIRSFETLLHSFPSMLKIVNCPCGFQGRKMIYTIIPRTAHLFEDGLRNLQTNLNNLLSEKTNVQCLSCRRELAVPSYELKNYIAVNVEFLYRDVNLQTPQSMVKNTFINKTRICDVPVQLDLLDKKFSLKGIICFIGENNNQLPVHYISYILSDNGEWKLFDSHSDKISNVQQEAEEKLALLIFGRT